MATFKASDQIDSAFGVFPDATSSEDSSSVANEPTEEQLLPLDLPATYKGNSYYTPVYTAEGFYTPWGKESLDQGISYVKSVSVGLSGVFLFIFALPFVIKLISSIISWFQNIMSE